MVSARNDYCRASASPTTSRLLRSSAIAALALAMVTPQAARAIDECGAATGATVTCTSAGNDYPNGITYIAPPNDLTIVLNSDVVVDTSGSLNIGVLAVSDATHSLTLNADTGASITTNDPGAFGVLIGTTAGNATANTSSIVTTGDAADGIFATADTGTVNISSATTYTYGTGARGISGYTGTGTINASGFTVVTSGDNAAGFNLQSQNGNVNATLARSIFGGTVLTYGENSTGVLATAGGNGNVSVKGPGAGGFGSAAVVTSGAGSTGVDARAQGGNVAIDLGQVQTTGAGADAILATSATGAVDVTASTVTADDGRGVVATGGTNAKVTQSGNFIATGGDNHAAVTVRAGTGLASAAIGNASTNGANSNAIDVASLTGMASANSGAATTQGSGSVGVIVSGTAGASAIALSTRTYGANANGIQVTSTGGTASATNNSDVRTAGSGSNGIVVSGSTGATVLGSGSVSTTNANAVGITASSVNGNANVTSGVVTTGGAGSAAIIATGRNASVTANGAVTRSGAAGGPSTAAISVIGTAGTASATVGNVAASGTGLSAVSVNGTTTAAATVIAGGTVTGNVDGLTLTSVTGSTIVNNGTLNTGSGYAVRATGGAASATNNGTLNGRVLLTAAGDSFGNAGTFNAVGISDFGAGNDGFANSGSLYVARNSAVPATVQFANLERFAASGLIDLRNGHTGDILDLGSASFTGSGNSRLGVDIQLSGTPSADRLNVGVANGSTQVLVSGGPTGPSPIGTSVLLVQGQSGSAAGAFALAPNQLGFGFTDYRIVYNPTNFTYNLVAIPSASAFRPLKLVEGARSLWYKSADAWSGHMTALRDSAWRLGDAAERPGSGLWLQMYGQVDSRRNARRDFSVLGTTVSAATGYQQDAFGGQIGYDFGKARSAGGFVFGLTAGYASSKMNFAGSADRASYNAANGGVYASYISGRFFANALAKYDRYWIQARLGDGAYHRKIRGDGYGGQLEAGFRLGGERFFVEPVASVAYVRTDLDNFRVPQVAVRLDDRNGLRGKAGARLGTAFDIGNSNGLLYASAMAVHEFEGRDQIRMISGGQRFSFRNARIPTYAHGTVGFNITTKAGITGFVEGYGDYAKSYRGGGVRGGMRLPF